MKKTKLADDLMTIKAELAALTAREDEIKAKLLALGGTEFEGKLARVSINPTEGRVTYDGELLKKHVPAATLKLCSKTGKRSFRFNVTARQAKTTIAA